MKVVIVVTLNLIIIYFHLITISDVNVPKVNASSYTVIVSKLVKYVLTDVDVTVASILLKKVVKVVVELKLFKVSWIDDLMHSMYE